GAKLAVQSRAPHPAFGHPLPTRGEREPGGASGQSTPLPATGARGPRRDASPGVRSWAPHTGPAHRPRSWWGEGSDPGQGAGRSVLGVRLGLLVHQLAVGAGGCVVDDVAGAALGHDLCGDLGGGLGVVAEELLGVLAALAEPRVAVIEPGARLLDD